MPNLTEREIIEKAIAGDTHAFRLIVEKNQAFAVSVSYRFMGNTDDAKDIAQEAFLRLWKNLPKYRFDIKLTTWLYKIIINLCLDHLKSKYRKQSGYTENVDRHEEVAAQCSADQDLLNEEIKMNVIKMANALTPKQRAVFILRDLEDLPIEEVSEILSMSAGNIKSNLYYARVKMGELFK